MLTRSFEAPEQPSNLIAYTPMIHSRMFTETPKFRDHHFQPTRSGLGNPPQHKPDEPPSDLYLDGRPDIDRPLFVQFCANDPGELLTAARYAEPFCDAVDLNLGCPQGIARRGNYGAFLQEDWDLIYRLINKLYLNLDVPVTAKMRILETKEKTLEYAQMILAAGASIITVHGRHRDQKGHKTGLADWSVLRYLRTHLPPQTVIFANGNILQHDDIHRCLEETGADGVMSAEGNLYDPSIFAAAPHPSHEGREYWRGKFGRGGYRMDAVFRRYMDILYEYVLEKPGPVRKPLFVPTDSRTEVRIESSKRSAVEESNSQPPTKKQKREMKYSKPTSPNLLAMQPHLFHLLRPLVAKHTDVRDALARSRAGDMDAFEDVLQMVEIVVKNGLLDYEANPHQYHEPDQYVEKEETANPGKDESSDAAVKACKRPWWVCQPYVRPLPKEALENGSLTLSKKDRKRLEEQAVLEKSRAQRPDVSAREKLDMGDGMDKREMPKEAMTAG